LAAKWSTHKKWKTHYKNSLEQQSRHSSLPPLPDEKKGERLIVLHTLAEQPLKEVLEKLGKSDLPALWRPTGIILKSGRIALSRTGKLDLRKAREMAQQLAHHEQN